jgi:hypothetical protein
VLAERAVKGEKVAVFVAASYVTVPASATPPAAAATVKVPGAVMVDAAIGALKVAAICWLRGTPVAPLAGTTEVTVGGGAVVKVNTKLAASASPVGSFAPVVIVAVYNVEPARGAAGVKVAVLPA